MRSSGYTTDLFEPHQPATEVIAPDVLLLRRFAAPTAGLVSEIEAISSAASFRQLTTPGGRHMSVAMTNCGPWGWHSDTRGYRYVDRDPLTQRSWPRMPAAFDRIARTAAAHAGFDSYAADACLINRYTPGARMGAHRDADERDMTQPIVSVSIGLPVIFLWYGKTRKGAPLELRLADGDVLVWGRSARSGYHGVRPLREGHDPVTGNLRYNLTFRRAH